jgi:hypothetical protein
MGDYRTSMPPVKGTGLVRAPTVSERSGPPLPHGRGSGGAVGGGRTFSDSTLTLAVSPFRLILIFVFIRMIPESPWVSALGLAGGRL